MANSTYLAGVTRCCLEVGVTPPNSAEQFNDNNRLPSPTLKIKLFYDTCQRQLIRTLLGKPTERRFEFNTVADQSDYDIDPLTKVESILYHTVRCTTTGFTRFIGNKTWNAYRSMYSDPTTIATGAPQFWICKPTPAESGVERTSQIIIVPTPNAVYAIEYLAKISAQPLVNATDLIMFEPEYEDVLWTWAKAMLESKLGVDATAERYAQSAIDQYRAYTKRPQEEKRGMRMGVSLDTNDGSDRGNYDYPDHSRGW
jgi:hypothetical protein